MAITNKLPSPNRPGPTPTSVSLVIQTTTLIPDPPATLGEIGAIRWIEIATILVQRGTWSLDWIPSLEHLCREYDNLYYVDQALAEPGSMMLSPSSNGRTLKVNPLLEYRLKTEGFIQSQLNGFGLTPASCRGTFRQDPKINPENNSVRVRRKKANPFDYTPDDTQFDSH